MTRHYPRPQLKRNQWTNLNGPWSFAFDDDAAGIREKWYLGHPFDQTIIVPFPYQSKGSGIHDITPHERVWYRHEAFIDVPMNHDRIILHFGAVDYESMVYVNGILVVSHTGGSTSFSADITDHLDASGMQIITVTAWDPTFDATISRGKQSWRKDPFECFYERTTGIWQTVWTERIAPSALKTLKMTPDIDQRTIAFEMVSYDESKKTFVIEIAYKGKRLDVIKVSGNKKACANVMIPDDRLHLWSPETPDLYDVLITIEQDGTIVDTVQSYVGMRKISVEGNRIHLNNEPYMLRLILDQGYHPEGLLTYPDDDVMTNDIVLAKKMGFNGCRKHEKIEPERFMYDADRLGFLVSLEMPSAYKFHPSDAFVSEWTDAINRDYNHPSLFMYVPFNESWGVRNIAKDTRMQDYVTAFYHLTKSLDPTRLVSSNDGWEQTRTDLCGIHDYRHGNINDKEAQEAFQRSLHDKETLLSSVHTDGQKPLYVDGYAYQGEPIILSEFGGISFVTNGRDGWGYTGVETPEDFERELRRLFRVVHDSPHLSGFCYTQLTDVMQEVNGLLSEDRTPKISLDVIKGIVTDELVKIDPNGF